MEQMSTNSWTMFLMYLSYISIMNTHCNGNTEICSKMLSLGSFGDDVSTACNQVDDFRTGKHLSVGTKEHLS
jgi:hypothetical protein